VHSHDYAPTEAAVERWVETMDAVGLEKTIILSGATGRRFDQIMARFGKHPKRFIVGAGLITPASTNRASAPPPSRNWRAATQLGLL